MARSGRGDQFVDYFESTYEGGKKKTFGVLRKRRILRQRCQQERSQVKEAELPEMPVQFFRPLKDYLNDFRDLQWRRSLPGADPDRLDKEWKDNQR